MAVVLSRVKDQFHFCASLGWRLLREHAKTARDLGGITTRNMRRGLVANTELEASWAPVDKLNSLSCGQWHAKPFLEELTLCLYKGCNESPQRVSRIERS